MNKSRRELLSMVAAGTLSFSGCTALESAPPGVAIEAISFSNFSANNHTIEYQLARDDQVVVDASVTLNAERTDSNGDDEYYANKIVEHEELHQQAVYTMRCRLADDEEWRHEFTFNGESYTCLKLSIDVNDHESMAVLTGEVPAERCSALTTTD
ncbi:hypothetical protein [Halobacterium noricense]|uniref:hypothetical protein n=1 Tax=Halobacterium noricense TaxID=223182 RepID=UPI001E432CD5|nr:hypothetical protein [Halobacterium noricense]UHH26179.1 hypothetical protein LT974_04405 [Halobacterium noricense]